MRRSGTRAIPELTPAWTPQGTLEPRGQVLVAAAVRVVARVAPAAALVRRGAEAAPVDCLRGRRPRVRQIAWASVKSAAQAACPKDPSVDDCTKECAADAKYYAPDCEAEMVALLNCIVTKGVASCAVDGTSTLAGCEVEQYAFDGCGVCTPVPSDGACNCCEAANCCVEARNFILDPSFGAYVKCRQGCGANPSCWSGCDTQFPQTGPKFDAYNFCINGACGTACFGG